MIADLRAQLAKHRAVILCASPGVGKTRMSKFVVASKLSRPIGPGETGNVLFAVHRRGLVDNASDSYNEEPKIPHGLIMSNRNTDWSKKVHIASIDTLIAWYIENDIYKTDYTFDLVCFDECHAHGQKLAKFLKAHNGRRAALGLKPTYLIGLSATPQAKGLSDVYQSIVKGPRIDWLIENNYLSRFRYFAPTQANTGLLVKRGGDFTEESIDKAFDGLYGDMIADWKRLAYGRPTVGFFHRLAAAKDAAARLNAAGIVTGYIDGATKDGERRDLFKALESGAIDYLCNVGVVERGTNIPNIACVQLCTAIGSVVKHKQILGRGSRWVKGKEDCLVLDHAKNIQRNGFFEDEIDWTLDASTNAVKDFEPRPTILCPQCQRVYRGGKCSSCGYEPSSRERKAQGVEWVDGELVELTRKAKEKKPISSEQIMIQALYKAGWSGRTWKQAIGIAKTIARQHGVMFKVPRRVEVAGRTYEMLKFGDPDGGRRVSGLFDFINRRV
jgi:superfamily II DNA or RNA helicase